MPESLHLISTEKMLCSRSKATWITLVIIMCRFALCESNYLSHPQNLLGDILHLFPYWSNSSHIEHVINEVSICFKNSEESQRLLERTPFRVADLAIAEPWVKVSNVFDSIDIQQVFQLSKCVKDLFPHNFEENRVFHEGTPHEYDGGHDVTYIGGFAQEVVPDIIDRIKQALSVGISERLWSPELLTLGIRVIDTLDYSAGGNVSFHFDPQSVYTALIMLSERSNYTGGELLLQDTDRIDPDTGNATIITLKPNKGEVVIFNSHVAYAIAPIGEGDSNVLVIEFWSYPDTGPEEQRVTPEDKWIQLHGHKIDIALGIGFVTMVVVWFFNGFSFKYIDN